MPKHLIKRLDNLRALVLKLQMKAPVDNLELEISIGPSIYSNIIDFEKKEIAEEFQRGLAKLQKCTENLKISVCLFPCTEEPILTKLVEIFKQEKIKNLVIDIPKLDYTVVPHDLELESFSLRVSDGDRKYILEQLIVLQTLRAKKLHLTFPPTIKYRNKKENEQILTTLKELVDKNPRIKNISITNNWFTKHFSNSSSPYQSLISQIKALLLRNQGYSLEGLAAIHENLVKSKVLIEKGEKLTKGCNVDYLEKAHHKAKADLKNLAEEFYKIAELLKEQDCHEAGYYWAQELQLTDPVKAYRLLEEIPEKSDLHKEAHSLMGHLLMDQENYRLIFLKTQVEHPPELSLEAEPETSTEDLSLDSENTRQQLIIKHFLLAGKQQDDRSFLSRFLYDYAHGAGSLDLNQSNPFKDMPITNSEDLTLFLLNLIRKNQLLEQRERKYHAETRATATSPKILISPKTSLSLSDKLNETKRYAEASQTPAVVSGAENQTQPVSPTLLFSSTSNARAPSIPVIPTAAKTLTRSQSEPGGFKKKGLYSNSKF